MRRKSPFFSKVFLFFAGILSSLGTFALFDAVSKVLDTFIVFSSSKYLSPALESSTGHIAQRIYSYTSSDSSNFALSLVLVITS